MRKGEDEMANKKAAKKPTKRTTKNASAKFADIQKILDDAVGSETLFTHGKFWQNKTRDEFVDFKIFGQCSIIKKFVGKESPLVMILRGDIKCDGVDYPRMPEGLNPIPEEKIQIISDWIDNQCPA
jgi:hypothetical protein